MNELLGKTFYGNTIQQWATAMAIVLAAVVIAKAVYWVAQRVGRKLTAKTKSRIDDILLDLAEEPFVAGVILFGTWLGLGTLELSAGVHEWVSKIFHVLVAAVAGWMLSRLADSIHREILVPLAEKTETDLDDQLLPILRRGSKTVIWSLALVVGLNNAGYDVGALLAGLGIGGLALAMAAKDTVSNMFGGFTIFTDQPFKLKDRIKVSGYDGTVEEIGLRSTRIRTLEGRVVTIPNCTFSGSPVENVSREPSRKVTMTLGLTYDMGPKEVETALEILRDIVESNDDIEDPKLGFTNFGGSSLDILFIYYIKKESDILKAQTDVNLAVMRRFSEAGLDFAFPTQTIHLAPQQAA